MRAILSLVVAVGLLGASAQVFADPGEHYVEGTVSSVGLIDDDNDLATARIPALTLTSFITQSGSDEVNEICYAGILQLGAFSDAVTGEDAKAMFTLANTAKATLMHVHVTYTDVNPGDCKVRSIYYAP